MIVFLAIISIVLLITSALPFIKNQHWIFRVPEFLKLQILIIQIPIFFLSLLYFNESILLQVLNVIQLLFIIYHIFIFIRYTKILKKKPISKASKSSESIKIISVNVYQFNTKFQKLRALIEKEKPDILLTMESNEDWEKALRIIENEYTFTHKVTLENTYGMHLYSKLKIIKAKTHFFVADDLPSIEAELETKEGYKFVLFGVHPPPPSPTEEATSKERDGDLLSIAKRIRNIEYEVICIGDFNNVAWSESSKLFRKTSELIDARIGRGLICTFHANYWFFRVPLDLIFHTPNIFIEELKTYPSIDSDHFPLGCNFHINFFDNTQNEEIETLEKGEIKQVNKLIEEGKKEESTNREPQ